MVHHRKYPFFTCVALAKAGLIVGPLRPSGRPSVCPSVRNTLGCLVCVICNSKSFHSFFIQTLPNDCSHIEDVHLQICARLIIFSLIF